MPPYKGLLVSTRHPLATQLPALLSGGPEKVWLADTLLKDFKRSGSLFSLLNGELVGLQSNASFMSQWLQNGRVELLAGPDVSLYLSASAVGTMENVSVLSTRPRHGLVYVMGAFGLTASFYREPERTSDDDIARTLQFLSSMELEGDVMLSVQAGRDVFRLTGEKGECPAILHLTSRPVCRMIWEYDPKTGASMGVTPAEIISSRIQFALQLLAKLPVSNSFSTETIQALIKDHPDHFIRWEATRTLLQLDLNEGLAVLDFLQNDPSNHVRKVARTTYEELCEMGIC